MGPVRAVAFDFNGTLSQDEPIMCAVYRELFAEQGRPMTEADYYDTLAGNTEEAIIGGWLGVDGDELARLVAERIAATERRSPTARPSRPRCAKRSRYAAERVPVAVVSGAFRREIEPVLEAAGISGMFTALVTADDVDQRQAGSRELRASWSTRLGDGIRRATSSCSRTREAGVASAKDAGLRCIAVRGTLPDRRLARADELVDAIDVELVRRLLG